MTKQTNPFDAALVAGKQAYDNALKAWKDYDRYAAMGKDNLEAVVKANGAALAGAEQLNKELMAVAQHAWKVDVELAKALAAAKTVDELVDLQKDYVLAKTDAAFAEGSKLADMTAAVANDVATPIQARVKVAMDTLFKPAVA